MNTRKHRMSCVDRYKTANGCEMCGYNKSARALCFDHLPEHDKNDVCRSGSRAGGMHALYSPKHPISDLLDEICKCRLLCCNCHMEVTYADRVQCKAKTDKMSLEHLALILDGKEIPKPVMCGYNIPWVGPCKNECPCPEHGEQMCTKCKNKPATRGCSHAGSLVCGRPLCDDCECVHRSW